MKAGKLLWAIVAFGALSAVLYSSLMPLWEGFDEPFHYGYVQRLSWGSGMPVLGRTPLSAEVWESLKLAPASHVVRQNLPFVMTFAEYFALRPEERAARRAALESLAPALRQVEASGTSNYEAQHAPLAYLLLVLPNVVWGDLPLPARVLRLRLVCALAACLLQAAFSLALARRLKLPEPAQYTALWLVLCGQMFYASVARVSNDWLAIPLATALLVCLLRFHAEPRLGNALWLGGVVAAGLLTKAYFLSWGLFALAAAVWVTWRRKASVRPALAALAIILVAAGPWYARNLLLYGSLGGTLQGAAGVGLKETVQAALVLPWAKALLSSARGALWTGNNSFTSFSAATLNLILVLLLVAVLLWLRSAWKRPGSAPEWIVAAGCLCCVATLLYACALFFAYSKDPDVTTGPWHVQAIAAPTACLLSLGLSRSGAVGRWLGVALVALFSYVLAATYLVKLIPLYAGYPGGKMPLGRLLDWYLHGTPDLAATALGPPALIWCVTAEVVVVAATVATVLCRRVWNRHWCPPERKPD